MNAINKSEIAAVSSGVSRCSFLQTSAVASGGPMLGSALSGAISEAQSAGTLHTPNAWVHIADDNTITLFSMRDGWEKLRIAGVQVREMLISTAADKWKVDRSTLRAQNGMVIGAGGKKATYGHLAAAASALPVFEKVALKDPKDFTIVGKRTKRLDTPAKVNGTATFGIDVKLPSTVYACLEQCPVIGGSVKSFDATKAKAMPGVIDVVQIPDGVAVVPDTYRHAKKAREALVVQRDEGTGRR